MHEYGRSHAAVTQCDALNRIKSGVCVSAYEPVDTAMQLLHTVRAVSAAEGRDRPDLRLQETRDPGPGSVRPGALSDI
jgi:hypothetical protein